MPYSIFCLKICNRWKEILVDYVNLLPFVNKVSVPEVIKKKFLRLCLGEHGQTTFDARRLDEATTLDDSVMHFDSIWGTGDRYFHNRSSATARNG